MLTSPLVKIKGGLTPPIYVKAGMFRPVWRGKNMPR